MGVVRSLHRRIFKPATCENVRESLNVDSCARIVFSTCLWRHGIFFLWRLFFTDLNFSSGLSRSYLHCFRERVHSPVSATMTTFRFNLWVQLHSPICSLGLRALTATIQIMVLAHHPVAKCSNFGPLVRL